MTADERPPFEGHEPRECGEHRTVGPHRAWCFDCQEWCYPASPCARCELAMLRTEATGSAEPTAPKEPASAASDEGLMDSNRHRVGYHLRPERSEQPDA